MPVEKDGDMCYILYVWIGSRSSEELMNASIEIGKEAFDVRRFTVFVKYACFMLKAATRKQTIDFFIGSIVLCKYNLLLKDCTYWGTPAFKN